jgi:hypothetical protein
MGRNPRHVDLKINKSVISKQVSDISILGVELLQTLYCRGHLKLINNYMFDGLIFSLSDKFGFFDNEFGVRQKLCELFRDILLLYF